jgi:hypothetical protein
MNKQATSAEKMSVITTGNANNKAQQKYQSVPTNEVLQIQIDQNEFISKAKALITLAPKQSGGFPTIPLLLFFKPSDATYGWYPLAQDEDIEKVVAVGSNKKGLLPIGCIIIQFEKRRDGRIHLADQSPFFVNEQFDAENVLNGTVPYFMRDKFGYSLGSVRFWFLAQDCEAADKGTPRFVDGLRGIFGQGGKN